MAGDLSNEIIYLKKDLELCKKKSTEFLFLCYSGQKLSFYGFVSIVWSDFRGLLTETCLEKDRPVCLEV